MRKVLFIFLCFFLTLSKVFSQDFFSEGVKDEILNSVLEQINLKNQEILSELDSIKKVHTSTSEVTEEDIEIYKRCKSLSKEIPLDYNVQVKSYIDKYISKNYRPYMNRLLGLSKHYFPIYESILKASGLPEEIKYLSLVESSLNPHLVSTSGAVGPWQFIHVAAKEFNLEMNSNFDERKDAYSSTYAVSEYIADAYSQFGDWLLAIASYNCGRGCVRRAIERSGITNPTFWELESYLPNETRNYVPKFIAMTYVLSDPGYYDISPVSTELDLKHDVMMVDRKLDLVNISKALGMSVEDFKAYNPSYKNNIVYGSVDKPKRVLLPITNAHSDSLLYIALHESPKIIVPFEEKQDGRAQVNIYKVKPGETLALISKRFGVSVQNLKAWNNLTSKSSILGRTLVLEKPIASKLSKNVNSIVSTKKKPSVIVYTVKKGDSLDKIANKYNGITVSKLKADNNLKKDIIKPGMKIKIKGNI